MTEIERIQLAEQSVWLTEIQYSEFPIGLQYSMDLPQPRLIIRKISEPERRCHQIVSARREWQRQCIRFYWNNAMALKLLFTQCQHLVRKINTYIGVCSFRSQPTQRKCHITGSATKVKHMRMRVFKNTLKTGCRGAPPKLVYIPTQDMVRKVIPW